jgi:iron(III) transport system substrate-binding protein
MTALLVILLGLQACARGGGPQVVAYISVDQVYAEPIVKAFERQSGIEVRAVYDVEAAKTTGLVTRLIAEKERPRADVFWNGEFVQTLRLKAQGVLESCTPASAADIPPQYRDAGGCWFGLGGRARILLVNRDLLKPEDYPRGLQDLLNPKYPPDRIGMALPLFGTTATHAAALYAVMGEEAARNFFASVRRRGVRIVDGNAVVRDMVVRGVWLFGLTDTDDALGAIREGAPVAAVAPDQQGQGTLVVPGTVALVRGAPHRREAEVLVDYLLRAQTEQDLIRSGFSQWSVRGDMNAGELFRQGLHTFNVPLDQVHDQLPRALEQMREIFSR